MEKATGDGRGHEAKSRGRARGHGVTDPQLQWGRRHGAPGPSAKVSSNPVLRFQQRRFGSVRAGLRHSITSAVVVVVYYLHDAMPLERVLEKHWKDMQAPPSGVTEEIILILLYYDQGGIIVTKSNLQVGHPRQTPARGTGYIALILEDKSQTQGTPKLLYPTMTTLSVLHTDTPEAPERAGSSDNFFSLSDGPAGVTGSSVGSWAHGSAEKSQWPRGHDTKHPTIGRSCTFSSCTSILPCSADAGRKYIPASFLLELRSKGEGRVDISSTSQYVIFVYLGNWALLFLFFSFSSFSF